MKKRVSKGRKFAFRPLRSEKDSSRLLRVTVSVCQRFLSISTSIEIGIREGRIRPRASTHHSSFQSIFTPMIIVSASPFDISLTSRLRTLLPTPLFFPFFFFLFSPLDSYLTFFLFPSFIFILYTFERNYLKKNDRSCLYIYMTSDSYMNRIG